MWLIGILLSWGKIGGDTFIRKTLGHSTIGTRQCPGTYGPRNAVGQAGVLPQPRIAELGRRPLPKHQTAGP
jgi:hypothetical protein